MLGTAVWLVIWDCPISVKFMNHNLLQANVFKEKIS